MLVGTMHACIIHRNEHIVWLLRSRFTYFPNRVRTYCLLKKNRGKFKLVSKKFALRHCDEIV